jgi:Tol biopolymer transport system component/predicted Ser/Thr protein kinase
MDIVRLNRIEEVHYEALNLPAGNRQAFLAEACRDDPDLRREVESLLAFSERDGSFLDSAPEALAAEMFAEARTGSELIGKQISHYKIINLLGSGGMGEVYLAEDTKLRRNVALKLLPMQFHTDAERRRRFEKEARAISALNHPNIITIYEIENESDVNFIATEFIDGHTLRELLSEKPLAWQEAVRIAIQVTDALDSAHSVGIVHRDIKPGNIMVRRDGIVKVLDFGLAKLTEPDTGEVDTREQTAPHRVMGTINYMSPEQALGERIDTRTDIFSFGVVLYEMLTGALPYAGSGDTNVNGSTIHRSLSTLNDDSRDIPPALGRIVKHALEKDRDVRYQTFADLRTDLKNLLYDSDQGLSDRAFTRQHTDPNKNGLSTNPDKLSISGSEAAVTGPARRWAIPALAALLVALTGVTVWYYEPFGRPKAVLSSATTKISPFTSFPGAADQPAFSPDGRQIAFSWDGGGKNIDLYVKLVGAGSPLRLTTNPAQDISPSWSPDGRYLAFIRRDDNENAIFVVPALGGSERKVGTADGTFSSQLWTECRLNWSPDGKTLAVPDRLSQEERYGIFLVSAEDGEKHRFTSPPENSGDGAPAFSPDGQKLAFIRSIGFSSAEIYVTDTRGGEPRPLTHDGQRIHSLAWTADGQEIVFSSNRGGGFGLWRVAVDGGIPEQVAGTGQNAFSPAISLQGDQMVYNVSFIDSNIWRADGPAAGRKGTPTKLISSTRQDHSPQYSPDGKKIAFASDRSGSEEIWTCESDGSNCTQLTSFNGSSVGSPRWSPDSRQIVFDARPNGNADIFVISIEGGKPRALVSEPYHDVMASWSWDGAWVYFCSNRTNNREIWKIPAAGGEAVQVTQGGGFEAFEAANGEALYYTKGRGASGVWQTPTTGGEETQVPELIDAAYFRYWAVSPEGIYFVAPAGVDKPAISFFAFANRRTSKLSFIDREPLAGPPGLTVSPDGRSILYAQADQSVSDIMLIENFR